MADASQDLPESHPLAARSPDHRPAPRPPIPKLLEGQPALVTGGSSGIGAAVALGLAEAGADVVVNYASSVDKAEDIAHKIEAMGRKAIALKADVSKEEEVVALFETAIKAFGTLHISVANAGMQDDAAFLDMTLEQWNKVIGIDLTGQFLCQRQAAREFVRRGVDPNVSVAAGKMICMSSVHQVVPWAGHVNYAASKGAIKLLMESMAQELAPKRIRVNAIAPGAIRTPINKPAWETPEAYRKLMNLVPYDRIGEPQDIAQAAVWLVSDNADYVTGATLTVDGGMTLYPGFAHGG